MKIITKSAIFLALVTIVLLVASGVQAQTGGGYDLTWWTVDGGGGKASGGSYVLIGTAGQPDAGSALTGSGYELVGGFWPGGGAAQYKIYLPLALRNF